MTTEDGSVPGVLAVVLARAARVIIDDSQTALQVVGDDTRHYNYASLLGMYAEEAVWMIRAWVELEMPGFSIRRIDQALLHGYTFSSDVEMLVVGFCYADRPQDEVVTQLGVDERIYCLSAPQGFAAGIDVRRL